MERLSLPRRNYQATEVDNSAPICRPELPKDPLPTWVTLPMDSKLPMIPGPKKKVLLYTTNLGEKRHKSTPELDFDLTDPYSLTMSNDYKPLHDPHLRPHLDTAHMRKRLRRGGFITEDGKVICTLREYNEYRQYLRKINLALDRKRECDDSQTKKRTKVDKDGDADHGHETRVKEIRERLRQQEAKEKARYQRLMTEDEEKHRRLREIHMSKMSEKEQQLRQEQERRLELVRRKQDEDRAQKMEVLRRWLEEDEARIRVTEKRRKQREGERERKLVESWDERKRVQQQQLAKEQQVRKDAEQIRQQRLAERERLIQQRRQHQQAIFEKMTKRQREEREKLEADCSKRIADRMARRKARAKRKRKKVKHKKMKGRHTLKSNWDVTELLLQEFSEPEEPFTEERLARDKGKARGDFEVRAEEISSKDEEMEIEQKISELGLDDFKGAVFSHEALADSLTGEGKISDEGIPTAKRLTLNMAKLIQQTQEEEVEPEHIAPVLVHINNYLAGKVLYPAYRKVKGSKTPRSIRFSSEVDQFEIYQDEYDSSFSEYEEEEEEDIDLEDEELPSDGSRLAIAVDSLTKLRQVSSTGDQSQVFDLIAILNRILDRLHQGEIAPEKAAQLAQATTEIFGESPLMSMSSSSLSGMSNASYASSTSMIAAEMVQSSMDKVQQELLNQYTVNELNEFYGMSPIKATSSELTGMAKFVAETALAMAVESLMGCTDDVITKQKLGKGKVMSDSELLRKGDGRRDLPARKSDSTESVSCPSEFILDILAKVLEEVRMEAASLPPPRPTGERTGSEPTSDTSVYVQELLDNAVSSVQEEMAEEPLRLISTPPKSKTSLFVLDTLQRVVSEIQRSRSPSATSLFIDDLLCKVTNESTVSAPDLSWQEKFDVHRKESSASLVSIFIRDTLSKVLNEIEKESKPDVADTSATSLFAREIVQATLRKCMSAVQQEMLPSKKLSELTAAIINSQARSEDKISTDFSSGSQILGETQQDLEPSQSSREYASLEKSLSMTLAENLVKTTLEKAQQFLLKGSMSAEQVVQHLNEMTASTGHVAALDIDGKAVPASTCTSEQAVSYVSAAIDKAIQGVSSDSLEDKEDHLPEGLQSATALQVSNFIQATLANAIRQLCLGLTDESAKDPLETDLHKSVEALLLQLDDETLIEDYPRDDDSTQGVVFERDLNSMSDNHTTSKDIVTAPEGDQDDMNYSDSEEEEEILLQPVYQGKPVDIDPEVARQALGAISVKNLEEMDDPAQALPRNSFRNLVCPEVSSVSGLDTSSATSTRSQLERASKGMLPSQTRLRVAAASRCTQKSEVLETFPEDEDDEAVEERKITKTRSLSLMNKPPSKEGSDTSPYGSPGSSPKPSKATINRAALVGASAPSLRVVGNSGGRSSPTKSPQASAKDKGSKKSLTAKTSGTSSSQAKLSPKKSSELKVGSSVGSKKSLAGRPSGTSSSTSSQSKLSPKKSSGTKVSHGTTSSKEKVASPVGSKKSLASKPPATSSSYSNSSQSKLSPKKSSGTKVSDGTTSSKVKFVSPVGSKKSLTSKPPATSSSYGTSSQSKLSPKKSSELKVADGTTSSNEKFGSPVGSKKSLTSKPPATSSSHSTSSKTKVSPKKSVELKMPDVSSTSSLKKKTSPMKQRSSKTLTKVSTDNLNKNLSSSSVKAQESKTSKSNSKTDIVKSPTPKDVDVPSKTKLKNSQAVEDETQVEEKQSQIRDKPLPRESQPIEMTTSSTPPARKRSSDLTPKTSNTSTSSSHHTVNLAPRPSSGFRKSLSGNLSKSSQHSGPSVSVTTTRSAESLKKSSDATLDVKTSSQTELTTLPSGPTDTGAKENPSKESVKNADVSTKSD